MISLTITVDCVSTQFPFLQTFSPERTLRSLRPLRRGFTIGDVCGDSEFDCVRHDFPDVHFNILAANGHVGEVECSIRTMKERLCALLHGLPFRRVPKLFLQCAIVDVNRLLNIVPAADGMSSTLSPATIITGQPRPDFTKLSLEFGSYIQVFDDFAHP
jgi:hypothetical protein